MANQEHLAQLRMGVQNWNKWRKSNPRVKPDLSDISIEEERIFDEEELEISHFALISHASYLSKKNRIGDNLSGINLSNTNLQNAYLTGTNFSRANLSGANLRNSNLIKANLSYANLSRADLTRASLIDARLTQATLRDVNFSNAELNRADLSFSDLSDSIFTRTQVLGTVFSKVNLTGACIQDWHLSSTTVFEDVNCHCVYMEVLWDAHHKKWHRHDRCPHDPNAVFKARDFEKLVVKAINTVDLLFRNGINWKAFAASFQKFRVESGNEELTIQAIENKGDGDFIIRVGVPINADKLQIERFVKREYEIARKALENNYRIRLEAKDREISIYRQQSANLTEVMKLMAERPINVGNIVGNQSMSDTFNIDQSRTTNPSTNIAKDSARQQLNLTNKVQGREHSLADAIEEIEEILSKLAQKYPSATDLQKQTVLQMELQQIIENDPSLRDRLLSAAKAGGLELVKVLTNNPFVSVPLETVKGWLEAEAS